MNILKSCFLSVGKGDFFFLLIIFLFANVNIGYCQGYNHTFLIGYAASNNVARINFDTNSVTVIPEVRKMKFRATQGNVSNANGNLLMVSNGVWIANTLGDTMMNGSGLNPNTFTSSWINAGLPLSHANLFIPFPGDSTKFVLFHQTGDYDMPNVVPSKLYYTVIDMTLDAGLGGVITGQKNLIAFQDTLSVGIAACKHSNGRDWWIIAIKDSSNTIYKFLFTPSGITNVSTQTFSFPIPYPGNAGQPSFSPDGVKFAYTSGKAGASPYQEIRIFSFDRCTGVFDTLAYIYKANQAGFGLAFSSNSQFLYYSSFLTVHQINTDTSDIPASDTLIATYDGFMSGFPPNCCATDFWLMYLAANGKIYISSGNGVIDMHFINYPDNGGLACDVHQHDLPLPCFSVRGNVNHPNYYLGCDTTGGCTPCYVGIEEPNKHDLKFSISPNPNNGNFKIIYLLLQNKSGTLEIFDINGRKVYSQNLPQWSTLQFISLPKLSDGIYNCIITSGESRATKKVVVLKE